MYITNIIHIYIYIYIYTLNKCNVNIAHACIYNIYTNER